MLSMLSRVPPIRLQSHNASFQVLGLPSTTWQQVLLSLLEIQPWPQAAFQGAVVQRHTDILDLISCYLFNKDQPFNDFIYLGNDFNTSGSSGAQSKTISDLTNARVIKIFASINFIFHFVRFFSSSSHQTHDFFLNLLIKWGYFNLHTCLTKLITLS